MMSSIRNVLIAVAMAIKGQLPSVFFFSATKSNNDLIFGCGIAAAAVIDELDDEAAVSAADVTVVARDDGPGGNARLLSIRPLGAVPYTTPRHYTAIIKQCNGRGAMG
jgi:hypothetical protein